MFDSKSLLGIILILIFIGYRRYKKHFSYWRRNPVIPSIPGQILCGNLVNLISFKTSFGFLMKEIYDDAKFQNEAVVGIYTLEPAMLVRDPELIKSILIRDFNCFRNRFSSSDPHHDPIGALSLFLCRYDVWKDLRTKLSPIFSTVKMKQMYPLIQQVGENLEKYLESKGERFTCELKELTFRYTTDTMATTTFGISSDSLNNNQEEVYIQSREISHFNLKRALNFMVLSMIPKFSRFFKTTFFFEETSRFARRATEIAIQDRETSGINRNDMIDIFVKMKNELISKGGNLKEVIDVIAAQTVVFLGGGTETSSSTISNLLLEIAKNPSIQQRIRQEILKAFVEGKGSISYEDICGMEYVDMVIDETLRLYPVFPFLERQYLKPSDKSHNYSLRPFYDYDMPEGMAIYIPVHGLHCDPKVSCTKLYSYGPNSILFYLFVVF